MFSETSIIKQVNILAKVICYLLVFIMMIIVKDPKFLLFIDVFFLLVTKKFDKLFIFNIILTVLIILNIFYPHFMWINKLSLLVLYTILLLKVTKLIDLRYILERTLYKSNNKKLTYKLLYSIYFINNFNSHFKRMLLLKDDYSMKLDINLLIFIIKQSYIKAKLSKIDFIELNNMRFYNYSKERTSIDKTTWESWDTNYVLCHIIVLFISIFYGR